MRMQAALDSGKTIIILGDQRDLAALEAYEGQRGVFTGLRYMAWNAAKRNGQYSGSWQQWNTTDCVEVTDVTEPVEQDGEGEKGLNPGLPARNAAGG